MSESDFKNILIIQTAFVGDVILTLPLLQILKRHYPLALIDVVVIPSTAELLMNNPNVNEVIIFDKKNKDSGLMGLIRKGKILRQKGYDIAFVPHRSMRSAVLARLSKIPRRIGFNRSAGRFLFSDLVYYQEKIHEINRNLTLLNSIGAQSNQREYPQLYPSSYDRERVDLFLLDHNIQHTNILIAIAPGTVWNTKRWLEERFAELVQKLVGRDFHVALIGGKDDEALCDTIYRSAVSKHIHNSAGKLTLLQSAELIRRCKVLICNDSAPMHLAVAMKTPVVAIFGATVPEFGFAPYGEKDIVIETKGLACRPCSIHGGDRCPIESFDCMRRITSDTVLKNVLQLVKFSEITNL